MTNITENKELEALSLEEIDMLNPSEAVEIIDHVESNTNWQDTAKHITHNGSGMNCP